MAKKIVTTREVAKALRDLGASVVTGTPKWDDRSNFWVIGRAGKAVVLNCQTHSVLGFGCIRHPEYEKTRNALTELAKLALEKAGIEVRQGSAPDQLFLSGYVGGQ
jgi:hypothetical protein